MYICIIRVFVLPSFLLPSFPSSLPPFLPPFRPHSHIRGEGRNTQSSISGKSAGQGEGCLSFILMGEIPQIPWGSSIIPTNIHSSQPIHIPIFVGSSVRPSHSFVERTIITILYRSNPYRKHGLFPAATHADSSHSWEEEPRLLCYDIYYMPLLAHS